MGVKIMGATLAYTDFKSLTCSDNCSYIESAKATFSDANNAQGEATGSITCNNSGSPIMWTGTFTATKQ